MALYEHVYLVRQDVTAPQVEALTETLKTNDSLIQGVVDMRLSFGRSLAFENGVLHVDDDQRFRHEAILIGPPPLSWRL